MYLQVLPPHRARPPHWEGYEMTVIGMSQEDKRHDVEVLNRSLYFENQGVWTYDFAATKLSQTDVGKAVLALALENKADHEKHQELLISAIHDLGGTPVKPEKQYDLSDYLKKREGDIDSDVNIAKLALALETDAAVGYIGDTMDLKSRSLMALTAGIANVEAIHAARIRTAFNALGVRMPIVPASVINKSTRDNWVLKVSEQPGAHP
jgi:hypothetical protein